MTDEITPRPSFDIGRIAPIPADRNPVLVYLGSLSAGSRRSILGALQLVCDTISGEKRRVLAKDFPWWKLRYEHIMKVRADLSATYAPSTVNKTLTAVKQVLRECRRLGLMTADACAAATDIKPVRGSRLPPGRALSPTEIERLLETAGNATPVDRRNRAALMLLAFAGLRRDEIVQLDLEDYKNKSIRVLGKGNKERSVPVGASTLRALEAWIAIRGNVPGPLFYRGRKGGELELEKPLSHNGVYAIVCSLAETANVLNISPHDFRRTFISELLDRGNDISTVSQLVGHSSVVTTSRYDRRGEETKRKAVDSLEPREK